MDRYSIPIKNGDLVKIKINFFINQKFLKDEKY